MVHHANIAHILEHGLCNRSHPQFDPAYVDIGHPDIVGKRTAQPVGIDGYGDLGEYVPFYFCGHTPMLLNIITGKYGLPKRSQRDLVFIHCPMQRILDKGCRYFYTDGNAKVNISRPTTMAIWINWIGRRSALMISGSPSTGRTGSDASMLSSWCMRMYRSRVSLRCKFWTRNGKRKWRPWSRRATWTSKWCVDRNASGSSANDRYTTGNLLEADTEALVNTVNTVGVMGKGIALQFAERFKTNLKVYKEACKSGALTVGQLLAVTDSDLHGERLIINFPTKKDWKHRSSYAYIEEGLKALVALIEERNIKSIALPPLGCGNRWSAMGQVKPMIGRTPRWFGYPRGGVRAFGAIEQALQKETSREVKLTLARAMLLHALFNFERLGEPASLFVANKLAFFLKLLGEEATATLEFKAANYGPYSVQVQHVLYDLNGAYAARAWSNTMPSPSRSCPRTTCAVPEVEAYIGHTLNADQHARLQRLTDHGRGFPITYAGRLLASVAYILNDDAQLDVAAIQERMKRGASAKEALADTESVRVAYEHLAAYGNFAIAPDRQRAATRR
ncbi:MAG: DUF4433 domain-containing protein [Flavobacteriales bacterium]|nr:DUF4433 domain-containing protein [Flavobacteriales bacterium]